MTYIDRTFMPAVADEGHILFDTEVLEPNRVISFFQDPRRTSGASPRSKIPGVDTNMLWGGAMPAGCAKEMVAVRLVSKSLPADFEVPLRLLVGCMPKLDRRVKLGEWISLETCGLRLDDSGQAVPSSKAPLFFRESEGFAFNVMPLTSVPGVFDLRIEVAGTFWRPAYGTPAHTTWRNRRAAACVESVNGRAMVGDGLFDIDVMQDGLARLFVSTRTTAAGRFKTHGEDTNLVGNGSTLCRGHMKHVTAIEIEPQTDIKSPLDVRLLLSGFQWAFASLERPSGGVDRRVFRLFEPLNLLECEHFVVEVSSARVKESVIKATLLGPLYVPGPQPQARLHGVSGLGQPAE